MTKRQRRPSDNKTWEASCAIVKAAKLDPEAAKLLYGILPRIYYWRDTCRTDGQLLRAFQRRIDKYKRIQALTSELLSLMPGDPLFQGPIKIIDLLCEHSTLISYGANAQESAVVLRRLLDAAKQIVEADEKFLEYDSSLKSSLLNAKTDGEEGRRAFNKKPASKKKEQTQETMLFLRLRDTYMKLGGSSAIGKGGPLYRFVCGCVDFSGGQIAVPSPASFRIRMMKAIKQRQKRAEFEAEYIELDRQLSMAPAADRPVK